VFSVSHVKPTIWGLAFGYVLPSVAFVAEEGSVHVPNCKSFLVTEPEMEHVKRRARFQQL